MISSQRNATRYVNKLSHKLRRRLDAFSSVRDYSSAQGRILSYLLLRDCDIFQKDIEEEYSIRPATATVLLKKMEKNGLIKREPVSYDARLKKITLTPAALTYREQVFHDIVELETDLTRGISEEELQIFYKVMEKMMENL